MQLFESARERLLRGGHFGSVNVRFWPSTCVENQLYVLAHNTRPATWVFCSIEPETAGTRY
jgi:hypothetical protein